MHRFSGFYTVTPFSSLQERSKQVKDLERQKSRDVVNELSSVFTTTTRSTTSRSQQQPQQQAQIVTGTPIRGPQPDEVRTEDIVTPVKKLSSLTMLIQFKAAPRRIEL